MVWLKRAFALLILYGAWSAAARMMGWLIALLAGTITGILSAFGIGGGSLLLIYLTSFAAIDQHQAQGINLLYFLPAAAAALPAHHKHGLLDKKVILPAILAGLAAAGLAAWLSSSLDTGLLRKLFGLFLLYVGLRELFHKDPDSLKKMTPNEKAGVTSGHPGFLFPSFAFPLR